MFVSKPLDTKLILASKFADRRPQTADRLAITTLAHLLRAVLVLKSNENCLLDRQKTFSQRKIPKKAGQNTPYNMGFLYIYHSEQ